MPKQNAGRSREEYNRKTFYLLKGVIPVKAGIPTIVIPVKAGIPTIVIPVKTGIQ